MLGYLVWLVVISPLIWPLIGSHYTEPSVGLLGLHYNCNEQEYSNSSPPPQPFLAGWGEIFLEFLLKSIILYTLSLEWCCPPSWVGCKVTWRGCSLIIEDGFLLKKKRQRSSLLLGGQHCFNSLQR